MANSLPVPLGLSASFGFGDRIGLATTGHVLAMKQFGKGIKPIFPQQSIREMARTGRKPEQVMHDAMDSARSAGWSDEIGADADHLKNAADVERTVAAGFTFFTIDPSDFVDAKADGYTADELQRRYESVASETSWMSSYFGKRLPLANGTVLELSETDCKRAAVKYGRAINHAIALSKEIDNECGKLARAYEIELSIDETEQPTTLAEHYIIADRCIAEGMKLVSLAPRFIGDFEKGVDYKGDLKQFEKSFSDHATLAAHVGPYKLSLHSGSDKLSIYGIIAKLTKGMFHVKTAGTSYLEALRVVAHKDPKFFREIVGFARSRYDEDRATYHVSATLASVPDEKEIKDDKDLEEAYLGRWENVPNGKGFTQPGRQILHCTFGSVLNHPEYKPRLKELLEKNRATYDQILLDHFGRHLQALHYT